MKLVTLTLSFLCLCSVGWAQPSEVVLQTIVMEAGGEPLEGQAMVARVIIERGRACNSLEKAVLKPKAFSCWNDGGASLARLYTPKARKQAKKALEMASRLTCHPTHYHTLAIHPYWAKGHKPLCTIGHHVFYEGIR